jgi:hypothetical protein
MTISKSKLKAGDLLETMKFSYCADKEEFVKAFKRIGLPINSESDLETLNEWSKAGLDKLGKIKNEKGELVKFNIKNFVKYNIKLRHNQVLNCKIKFDK